MDASKQAYLRSKSAARSTPACIRQSKVRLLACVHVHVDIHTLIRLAFDQPIPLLPRCVSSLIGARSSCPRQASSQEANTWRKNTGTQTTIHKATIKDATNNKTQDNNQRRALLGKRNKDCITPFQGDPCPNLPTD